VKLIVEKQKQPSSAFDQPSFLVIDHCQMELASTRAGAWNLCILLSVFEVKSEGGRIITLSLDNLVCVALKSFQAHEILAG